MAQCHGARFCRFEERLGHCEVYNWRLEVISHTRWGTYVDASPGTHKEREIFKVAFDRYRGFDYTHTTGAVPHRRYVRSGRHAPWRVEPDWARAVSPSKCTAARSAARSSFSVRTDTALIALVTRLHPELDAGKKGACTVIPVLDTAAKGGHS